MPFEMPQYYAPDFSLPQFVNAPDAAFAIAEMDGVAPDNYHSTSMYPEYFKVNGKWVLAEESRMDSSVVICDDGHLAVVENRNIRKGDKVILGRTERCEEGIFADILRAFIHCGGSALDFNVVDKEQLLRAKEDPESYRNLIVRVCGYSAPFISLSEDLQDEVIQRTMRTS